MRALPRVGGVTRWLQKCRLALDLPAPDRLFAINCRHGPPQAAGSARPLRPRAAGRAGALWRRRGAAAGGGGSAGPAVAAGDPPRRLDLVVPRLGRARLRPLVLAFPPGP